VRSKKEVSLKIGKYDKQYLISTILITLFLFVATVFSFLTASRMKRVFAGVVRNV
jgi:hypothetical protein